MRRFSVLLAVVFALVALSACGRSEVPEPKAEKKPVVTPWQGVLPGKAELEAEQERRQAELREMRRARDLAEAKDAIARFRGRGSDWDWTAVVKGGASGPSAELCSRVEVLLDLQHLVFGRLDAQHEDRLSIGWLEVGVERADLWKEFAAASKKAATALLVIYKRPLAERDRDIGCGRGEGSWRFDEPGQVMQRLLWVMEFAGIKPTDIGTTAEAMRQALVADYRAYIARYRGMIARGEASRSDGGGIIAAAVRDAEQLWAIPRAQLGLTPEEIKMLK